MNTIEKRKGSVPFFPHHLITEVSVAFAILGFVLILAGLWPAHLGPPANTIMTPENIMPEWYFLWIFGLLAIVPDILGVFLPVLLIIGLIAVPWLDRGKSKKAADRAWLIYLAEITLIIMVVLTYIGLIN
ncbi:MAG: cytochrome b subunit of the bc complex [Bacillota bacterium]